MADHRRFSDKDPESPSPAPYAVGPVPPPSAHPHPAPSPTGESGTTTDAQRDFMATHPPAKPPSATHDPSGEPGYAGYQSGVHPVGDPPKDPAGAGLSTSPQLSWLAKEQKGRHNQNHVYILATAGEMALAVNGEDWDAVQAGTLAYTTPYLVRSQDVEKG